MGFSLDTPDSSFNAAMLPIEQATLPSRAWIHVWEPKKIDAYMSSNSVLPCGRQWETCSLGEYGNKCIYVNVRPMNTQHWSESSQRGRRVIIPCFAVYATPIPIEFPAVIDGIVQPWHILDESKYTMLTMKAEMSACRRPNVFGPQVMVYSWQHCFMIDPSTIWWTLHTLYIHAVTHWIPHQCVHPDSLFLGNHSIIC